MAEVLAVAGLLVLAVGVVALRAVLDGIRTGTPASIAVLAPLAEGARLVRRRAPRGSALPVVAGAGLLLASVLRVLALPAAGFGWFLVADAVWWVAGALLARRGTRLGYARCALAVEVPLLLALAAPVLAARGPLGDAGAGPPVGLEAPVALLLAVVIAGVLLPWAVAPSGRAEPGRAEPAGAGRLLVGAGLAAQPVSAAAVSAALFLGGTGGVLAIETGALTALLVLAARRFPVLRRARLTALATIVLLPLALLQLAVVATLTLLA